MAKRTFVDVMKETINAIAPGLKNIVPEVVAEVSRQGTQGSLEWAQLMYTGGFHSYGPGQQTPSLEAGKGNQEHEVQKAEPQKEQEREHDGREM